MMRWRALHKTFPHHLFIILTLLTLIGLTDATYLSALHVRGLPPNCTLLQGCEKVTTSAYAVMWGVPLAFLGVAYYAAVLLLIVFIWDRADVYVFKFLIWLITIGFLGSLYFLYLQVMIIHALCIYCLISGVDTLCAWLIALRLVPYAKKYAE